MSNRLIIMKIKWWYFVFVQFIKKLHARITLELMGRYKNRIVFVDKSNFLISNVTHHDLQYSKENNGYFFDSSKLCQFIQNNSENNGIAIDVGANMGAVTYQLSKKFDTVIAFEPINSTFDSLCKNIELNKLNNVITEKVACFNENGTTQMFKSHYHGHSSLIRGRKVHSLESVKTIRLDKYLKNNKITKVEFLKVDTEGAELYVLLGLGAFLHPNITKTIVFEHIQSTQKHLVESQKLFELLFQKGYNLFDFEGNKLSERKILSSGNLDIYATREFII
jgi:FkbM family methyltransferase